MRTASILVGVVAREQSSPAWIILRRSHRSRWAAPQRDAQNAFVVLNRRCDPSIVIADVELSWIVPRRLNVDLMLRAVPDFNFTRRVALSRGGGLITLDHLCSEM